ncbi:PAP2-domain-containing protein [Calocera cornea HHB12733]|uniref:PAP2-domain-containing protein n=1 Tax=Calocera cornea HHB12733 TaxID=1353952 RepID=A0A165DW68_9BASI|nr:PAP2-domain-containing protein [Calocera cornea HHB12733]
MSVFRTIWTAFTAAVGRLETSCSPKVQIARLRHWQPTWQQIASYSFQAILATFWLYLMTAPPFPYKLAIPLLYITTLFLPVTAQFFIPATPIFSYLLSFYSSRFIPNEYRPTIHVALLPTLETVLYGANISDLLTRYTFTVLDLIAWIPYGVGHFTAPFFIAFFIWIFAQRPALRFFATAFGFMNLTGVLIQTVFPCAPPWYELIYGLTPADYSIPGHPAGLSRIDAIFHSNGYAKTFGASPVVFGAFPSLHGGSATMEALFLSHFFPKYRAIFWGYAVVLYWATMYLTHHYLIDVVAGACMSVVFFYALMPEELREPTDTMPKQNYERYDLEAAARRREIRAGTWTEHPEDDDDALSVHSLPEDDRTPNSAMPFIPRRGPVRAHRQTASIASLSGTNQPTDGDLTLGPVR